MVLIQTVPRKNLSYVKHFPKKTNIKIVLSPFQLQDLFCSKDCLPVALKSFIVYKFTCAECQSCSIGETKRHLPTRIKEQLQTDTKSHIPQHLNENPNCRDLLWQLLHNNWSRFIFLQIKTERGAPYNLVKASANQTEESRKYHNVGIM